MDVFNEFVFPCIIRFVGSLGFGVLYNVRRHHIFVAAFGAVVCQLVYHIMELTTYTGMHCCFTAAVAAAVYAEIAARLLKAPVTMYLAIGIIPIVPGTSAYYTMLSLIMDNKEEFLERLVETFSLSGAIAMGVFIVPALVRTASYFKRTRGKKLVVTIKSVFNEDDRDKGIRKI